MEKNKTIIQRFIDETLNKGDIEATEKFVAEDVIEQVPFPGRGPGIEGVKIVLGAMRAGTE